MPGVAALTGWGARRGRGGAGTFRNYGVEYVAAVVEQAFVLSLPKDRRAGQKAMFQIGATVC